MAFILSLNREIFILDEPTENLDNVSVDYLSNFIRQSDKRYIIVSHDRHFVSKTCENHYMINEKHCKNMKSIKLFFASRYNVVSITIVSIVQYLLYYFSWILAVAVIKTTFFQSNIVSILSFSFYMFVFYKLFSDGYYRLIAINFSKNKSIGIVYTDILRILLIGVFSWVLVYCISILIYYGKANFDFEYIKKYFIYFVLFQFFSLSLLII